MTITQLLAYLRSHHIDAVLQDGAIVALEHFTKDGKTFSQWVTLPANLSAVRDWLGY